MRPRLSIVVPVRDPAYGGGLLHRAQIFLKTYLAQAQALGLNSEVVFVEWNPRAGVPRFRDALAIPPLGDTVLRFIEVPESAVRSRVPHVDQVPFLNTWARNVGVRRAHGDFILVTGADVIFNGPLMRRLATHPLSERSFYRIDRSDLTRDIPGRWPVGLQLAYCSMQDLTVHTYYGAIREPRRWWPPQAADTRRRHARVLDAYERYKANPRHKIPQGELGDDRLIIPADGLHRNASGDFMLMHRERWHELRGYTELSTRGHGDSLCCWTASSGGVTQEIFGAPARLYHQPHGREESSTWPVTDWKPWYAKYLECRASGTALITNDETWGFAGETLPEWHVSRSGRLEPITS